MSGYIGRDISYGNAVVDHFTGNGGATYTLTYDTNTNGVVVSLDGVVQKNGTDFNVTGTSLVFTSTVASPIAIQVIYTGLTLTFPTPADNTVTSAKIVDGTIVNGDVNASAGIATSKLSGAVTSIASHGLGTSATVDTGTSANQILKLDGSAKIPAVDGSQLTNLPGGGKVLQVVNLTDGSLATGTTQILHDDSIPQNTEGTEYMSLAITPTSASSKLIIHVVFCHASNTASAITMALFQDSTSNALAAVHNWEATNIHSQLVLTHYMTAGTTSSTTFKVRAGCESTSTLTFNGINGGRRMGGVSSSGITIMEIGA